VVTYSYNAAGRALSAVDTANSTNYATDAAYAPHGALTQSFHGGTLQRAWSYNNRLQPAAVSVVKTGGIPQFKMS
jgi:hypothetical protein